MSCSYILVTDKYFTAVSCTVSSKKFTLLPIFVKIGEEVVLIIPNTIALLGLKSALSFPYFSTLIYQLCIEFLMGGAIERCRSMSLRYRVFSLSNAPRTNGKLQIHYGFLY